jgi:predicted nucleotidyltransferase
MKEIPAGMLEEIVRRLVESLHPLEIYLFGSHARGDSHHHSDLDLLVVVPDGAGDRHELASRGDAALWGLPAPIDIIVFPRSQMDRWAPVRHSLPGTVARQGKRLYVA